MKRRFLCKAMWQKRELSFSCWKKWEKGGREDEDENDND